MQYGLSEGLQLVAWSAIVGFGLGFGFTVGQAVATTIIGWFRR